MAGIITISKGHDASYPWRQIGTAEPGTAARNAGRGVGYYLSPAEKGGEPPGIWTGQGRRRAGAAPGGDRGTRGVRAAVRPASRPARPVRPDPAGPGTRAVPVGGGDLRGDAGRRARGDRRAARPADDRGESAGPDAGPVLGCDVQRVEVDLAVPRQRAGQRGRRRPARRPGRPPRTGRKSRTASGTRSWKATRRPWTICSARPGRPGPGITRAAGGRTPASG